MKQLRTLFLKYLTEDVRRKDFNQAIFDKEGWPVFSGTDLDMILHKFDMAVKEYEASEMFNA